HTLLCVPRTDVVKKTIVIGALALSPILALYVSIGKNSSSFVFAPAAMIHSALSGEYSSDITREIENYNLIVTLKENRFLGPGFGHEYVEAVKADDISAFTL